LDRDKAYEVLGVKPGVSNRDLKAAHRDLAKVWHPDRFLHDPRLQEKALEKLKEINEAYELLLSGRTPRPAPAQTVYSQPQRQRTRRRSGSWAFALLVFVGVFAVTTKVLLDRRMHQPVQEPEVVEQPEQHQSPAKVVDTTTARPKENGAAPEVATNETVATPTTAVATVTVTVDPETGLLAKPECRLRSRMTYPSGSEPTAYCNLSHLPPPKESRVKSIAKSVKRALD
jgi:DnaJ-like protein